MKKIKTIVVIPIGPTCKLEFVKDTVESVFYYMDKIQTKIILVDDSHLDKGKEVRKIFKEVEIVETPFNRGKDAGLYYSLSDGFRYVFENYKFEVLLRIDTDGLVIGKNPEEDAITFFKKNKKTGLLGSYKLGYDGQPRDFTQARRRLKLESSIFSLAKGLNRLKGIQTLRALTKKAITHGYILGENCMGGAVFYSYDAISALYENNYLPIKSIEWSKLQEDMIFGLLLKSLGVNTADFVLEDDPMGVKWRGLPDKPSNLIKRKKVIHSTKFYKDMNEESIRKYFKSKRI